jgi:hypothetical protein
MECQTCRWWKPTGGPWGLCLRYPPQPMAEDYCRPVTEQSEYCGEYAEAPTDTTAADS